MISITTRAPRHQRGMALIAALLVLLVITILGMAMFRSYGMQQRIGGNTRDKARAFHAAMAGQDYAEWFLTGNNGANAVSTTDCTGVAAASVTTPMVCTNVIPTTVAQPDTWGAAFTYQPPNMSLTSGGQGSYSHVPQFYISNLGSPTGAPAYKSPLGQNQALFQIDAAGWGSTPQTVAVVESTYIVSSISTTIPPSSSNVVQKNVFLGGP
jgi:type IV pilus assembly protein PilX